MSDPVDPAPVVVERPKPLRDLAVWIGPTVGLVGGIIGFLVPLGLIDQATADVLSKFTAAVGGYAYDAFAPVASTSPLGTWAAVISGLLPVATSIGAVALHARLGRQHVTPMSDPRDGEGRRLVPAAPVITSVPTGVDPHPGVADHARVDPADSVEVNPFKRPEA